MGSRKLYYDPKGAPHTHPLEDEFELCFSQFVTGVFYTFTAAVEAAGKGVEIHFNPPHTLVELLANTSTKTWSGNIWTTTSATALLGQVVAQSVLEEDVTVRYTATSSAAASRPYVIIRETRLGGSGAASNAVTETWRDPVQGHVLREQRPDGTVSIYGYENLVASTTSPDNGRVVYIGTGVASTGNPMELASGTAQTITYSTTQPDGQGVSRLKTVTTTAIPSGLILAKSVEGSDALGHVLRRETYGPDGVLSTESYTYNDFDQVETQTNRDGTTTEFEYDDQHRVTAQITRAGSTVLSHTTTDYDALGRVLATGRVMPGSNGGSATFTLSSTGYDALGRTLTRSDALGRTTTYAHTVDGNGRPVETVTYPGGGTVVTVSEQDGSPAKVTGTAASPSRHETGVESLAGVQRRYQKQIALDASGNDTDEWVKTYFDRQDRPIRTVYSDNAASTTEYDSAGHATKSVDPDGVTSLMAYDLAAQTQTSALDLNQNGSIDYATDRVSQTIQEVVAWPGSSTWGLRRTTTKVWDTAGSPDPRTVAYSDSSADGSYRVQTDDSNNVTTSVTAYPLPASGLTEVVTTVTTPDDAIATSTSSGGQLLAQSRRLDGASGPVVSSATYTYDAAGRLTDLAETASGRTIHTTRTYYADDQLHTVTRPDPDGTGSTYAAQTTTFEYDEAGRLWKTHLPDGQTVETRTYYPSGQVKKISGGLDYPQEYTYDAQGRKQTLKTWKDAANDSGAAVTTWSYSSARGWLTHKLYEGGTNSLSYTYTDAGRSRTLVRARGITATTSFNTAGEPALTTYSDGTTASVSQTYDRLGRPWVTTDAAGTLTRTYSGSHLITESYGTTSANLLSSQTLTRSYDAAHYGRATGLVTTGGHAVAYGYDSLGRFNSVSSGSLSATYGYFATYGANPIESVTVKEGSATRLTTVRAYDDAGRLTSVAHTASTSSTSTAALGRGYLYTALDQRAFAVDADGRYWAYTYDARGQVVSAKKMDPAGGTPAAVPGNEFAWLFDDIGNRKTATVNGRTATYTANPLNQYSQRTVPGAVDVRGSAASTSGVIVINPATTPPTNYATTRMGRDFFATLTVSNAAAPVAGSLSVVMATTTSNSVLVAREWRDFWVPQSPEAFLYDDDGNLTRNGQWTLAYDAENRLKQVETRDDLTGTAALLARVRVNFAYDAQGRRVQKKVSQLVGSTWNVVRDTRYLYDGWNLLAELDALNGMAVVRRHVWGLDLSNSLQGAGGVGGLLFTVEGAAGAGYAAASDGNGNIIGWIATATGEIAGEADFQPFGEAVVLTGVAKTMSHGFSTKYRDAETGLLYYG